MDINELIVGSVGVLGAVIILTVPRVRRSPRIGKYWPARVAILAGFGALLLDSGVRGRDNLELLSSDLVIVAVLMLAAERGGRSDIQAHAPSSKVE